MTILSQDLGSMPRSKVFQNIKVWVSQLFGFCLVGIVIAIFIWSEMGLWITTLAVVVINTVVLLLAILRAVKFLEQETDDHESHNSNKTVDRTV
jgi:hypothetical protein